MYIPFYLLLAGERLYKCEFCEKKFARPQSRDVHAAMHTGVQAHLCQDCGASYSSLSSLIDHRKRKHLDLKNFNCEECEKKFFTKQELEAHERTHTGAKPFVCNVSQCVNEQLDVVLNGGSFDRNVAKLLPGHTI